MRIARWPSRPTHYHLPMEHSLWEFSFFNYCLTSNVFLKYNFEEIWVPVYLMCLISWVMAPECLALFCPSEFPWTTQPEMIVVRIISAKDYHDIPTILALFLNELPMKNAAFWHSLFDLVSILHTTDITCLDRMKFWELTEGEECYNFHEFSADIVGLI